MTLEETRARYEERTREVLLQKIEELKSAIARIEELPEIPKVGDPEEPYFAQLVGRVYAERAVPGKFNNLVTVGAEAYRRWLIGCRCRHRGA